MTTPRLCAVLCALFCLPMPTIIVAGADTAVADRELEAPAFPESFKDRSWDEGILKTDGGDAKYQDMIARKGGTTLTLRRFCVPAVVWRMKTPKQMFDDARQNILRGDASIRLLSEKDFAVDGFPGRSFVFSEGEGKGVFRMDYFLLRPDLFIYSCFGSESDLKDPEILAFFASIRTTKKEAGDAANQAADRMPGSKAPEESGRR